MSHLRIVHLIFSLIFLSCNITFAQELNATVEINTQKIEGTNKSVFENLKTTLTEFINDRQWTSLTVLPQERIKCSFTIIVNVARLKSHAHSHTIVLGVDSETTYLGVVNNNTIKL